jgi:hypothetical protein
MERAPKGNRVTHALLVKKAATWLRSIGCRVVLTERTTGKEFHDAIGWRNNWRGAPISYVVECKVSVSDFRADRRKKSRASYDVRPAMHCYYLTPINLLKVDRSGWPLKAKDVPDGWGLLELPAAHRAVQLTAHPRSHSYGNRSDLDDDRTADQLRGEVEQLYMELYRYQAQGIFYPRGLERWGIPCAKCGEKRAPNTECRRCAGQLPIEVSA